MRAWTTSTGGVPLEHPDDAVANKVCALAVPCRATFSTLCDTVVHG
jgi:hypothetical protein